MSSAAIKPRPKLILVPFYKQDSDRILEGTENSFKKVFLNAPERLQISNTSFIEEDGTRRLTRWYPLCRSIFVDEQKDFVEFKHTDYIFINGGVLVIEDIPRDRLLYDFLASHNDNVSNLKRVLPENEDVSAFQNVDTVKEAELVIDQIEKREQAFSLLSQCKKGMGATAIYEEDILGKFKSIFGINSASNQESYLALYDIADKSPEDFVKKIDKYRQMIAADFKAAKSCGAISYKDGKYFINDEPVFESLNKDVKKHDPEFIAFLSTASGNPVYLLLRNKTTEKLNNPV